jgi:hypothetical protein
LRIKETEIDIGEVIDKQQHKSAIRVGSEGRA